MSLVNVFALSVSELLVALTWLYLSHSLHHVSLSTYGGVNENGPYRLTYLEAWLPICGLFVGGGILLGELGALGFPKSKPIPVPLSL